MLGAVLFGIDHVLASREDDPRIIVVDAEVDAQAIEVFKEARGREPNDEELYALRRVWLDNEVLYREGLALGLDKGDKAIRERVIFKALSVVDANVKLPPYDETMLREWFEANRARYDEPARFDFQEAVLAGERSEAAVRAFATALNAGTPGDAAGGPARVHGAAARQHRAELRCRVRHGARSRAGRASGGRCRAKKACASCGSKSITPAKPAEFEDLGGVVLQDWTDAMMAEQRSAAVRALAQKYTVKVADAAQ